MARNRPLEPNRIAGRCEAGRVAKAAARGEATPIGFAGWIVLMIRLCGLVGLLMIFVPLHYAYRAVRYGSPFPMLFLRYCAWIVGARVTRIGKPLRRNVFFISNHVSWVDILALAGASGTAFVAKHELRQVPVIGWLCSLNRTVHIERGNRLGIADQIRALRDALMDNWAVTIFPEGTTGDGQTLLPFKTAMLSVLEPPPPGVMVQPVLMDYGAAAPDIAWLGEETGLNNARRVLARRGHFALRIHFLDPFSPQDVRGRKAIGARAKAAIQAAMG